MCCVVGEPLAKTVLFAASVSFSARPRLLLLRGRTLLMSQERADAVDEDHRVHRGSGQPQIDAVTLEERAVHSTALGEKPTRASLRTAGDQHLRFSDGLVADFECLGHVRRYGTRDRHTVGMARRSREADAEASEVEVDIPRGSQLHLNRGIASGTHLAQLECLTEITADFRPYRRRIEGHMRVARAKDQSVARGRSDAVIVGKTDVARSTPGTLAAEEAPAQVEGERFGAQRSRGANRSGLVQGRRIVGSRQAGTTPEFGSQLHGIEVRNVLTGFKYIGEQIAKLEEAGEEERYLLGFEESYGYLSGGYVRDKDAVDGSMLICEMAAWYRAQGKNLGEALDEMYEKFGRYLNQVDSYTFEGADGMARMAGIMESLRKEPPKAMAGVPVTAVTDYQTACPDVGGVKMPPANVLSYTVGEGSVIVRPSGTEPKLKVYYSIKAPGLPEAKAQKAAIQEDIEKILGIAK